MPELPEVETIVRGLNKEVCGKKIKNIWTDWPRHFSRHYGGFKSFRYQVQGANIKKVSRIGKNIIFELSNGRRVLLHLKMTGRLLLISGHRKFSQISRHAMSGNWDPYIHTIFYLSGNKLLAFSDVRKFGKILSATGDEFGNLADIKSLGPDALKIKYNELKEALVRRKLSIKKALLDQKIIAGIGNIYADEILFKAGIHPFRSANSLGDVEIKEIYSSTKFILAKAIKLRGSSMSDYQDINGKLGNYYNVRLIYGREGGGCPRCKTKIQRLKLGGRSTHFCKKCQK